MAKRFQFLVPLISTIILVVFVAQSVEAYSKTTPFHGVYKPEKLTHLHFYFHDVITSDKPTAVRVAAIPGTNSSSVPFGVVMVADDPLTVGPDPNSMEVGRAQGMYTSSAMDTISFTMVFNLVFTAGEFKDSTLALYGRNAIFSKVRETNIIGGTGAFRFARGYAQATTNAIDGLNAIVEYNVFVWH